MHAPRVDVIIPTLGRRADMLWEAVRSALTQTSGNIGAVIIVLDDPETSLEIPESVASPLVRIVRNVDARTVSARTVGVHNGDSPWIAFLDDDDLWDPDKLRKQLQLSAGSGSARGIVVASRCSHRMDGLPTRGAPGRLIRADETVAEYLFHKRSPRPDRPSLFTSSLLAPRALCERVPWRRIPRHQDWDWLLRAERIAGVRVVQHPDILARIRVGTPGSISRSSDWASSLRWAKEVLAPHEAPVLTADFLASQTLRYALTDRSLEGVRSTVRAIHETGAMPHAQSIAVGGAGLMPVALIRTLLSRG